MWNNTKSLQLSILLVRVLFILIPILMLCVPIIVRWYDVVYSEGAGLLGGPIFIPLCTCLYLTAVCGMVCLHALGRLLKNLKREQVFIKDNCRYLRIISWCCILAAIPYGVFGIWRFMSLIIALTALFFGVILRVLKNVFDKAVELQEENDYTI